MKIIHDQARTTGQESTKSETWVDLYADSLFRYALLRIADKAVAESIPLNSSVCVIPDKAGIHNFQIDVDSGSSPE